MMKYPANSKVLPPRELHILGSFKNPQHHICGRRAGDCGTAVWTAAWGFVCRRDMATWASVVLRSTCCADLFTLLQYLHLSLMTLSLHASSDLFILLQYFHLSLMALSLHASSDLFILLQYLHLSLMALCLHTSSDLFTLLQ
jgi:hypothetical protein